MLENMQKKNFVHQEGTSDRLQKSHGMVHACNRYQAKLMMNYQLAV